VNKPITVLLVGVVVFLAAGNYAQWREIQTLKRQLNASVETAENTPSLSKPIAKQQSATSINTQHAEASELSPQQLETANTTQKDLTDNTEQQGFSEQVAQIVQSDEMKDMMQSDFMKNQIKYQMKTTLPPLYQDFVDEMQLGEAEAEQLLELIVEDKVNETQYFVSLSYEERLDEQNVDAYQSSESFENAMLDLIGDSGMEAFEQYEKTMPVRQELTMFNAHAGNDLALTREQMGLMVDSISQVSEDANSLFSSAMRGDSDVDSLRTSLERKRQSSLEQSANILNDAQQAKYEEFLTQQLDLQLMQMKMISNMKKPSNP